VTVDAALREQILVFQRNEISEHHIYENLARQVRSPHDSEVLQRIADDELRHYQSWKGFTQTDVEPSRVMVWFFTLISRIFGFTFAIKLMERGEEGAQDSYAQLRGVIPDIEAIIHDEHDHEEALIELLDEERLRYAGSMVLGLNDALVELTGALAGLTLALQDTQLIALTGSITGIAAALSMAASEYLSTKSEDATKNPLQAALYTGTAYILTVVILILPYLLLENYYICLVLTLLAAILVIALFNYYISVAKDEPFRQRFVEMAGLSLGVAVFSFLVGFVIRRFLGVEV